MEILYFLFLLSFSYRIKIRCRNEKAKESKCSKFLTVLPDAAGKDVLTLKPQQKSELHCQ